MERQQPQLSERSEFCGCSEMSFRTTEKYLQEAKNNHGCQLES